MVIALGHVACGVFSNNDTLARALVAAGDDAYDRALAAAAVGRLPGRPRQQLRRLRQHRRPRRRQHHGRVLPVALHARNTTGRISTSPASPGSEGKEKGATGRPVPLLTTWLLAQESAAASELADARRAMTTIDFYTHVRRSARRRGDARGEGVGAARQRARADARRGDHRRARPAAVDACAADRLPAALPAGQRRSPPKRRCWIDDALDARRAGRGARQPASASRRRSSAASSAWPRSSAPTRTTPPPGRERWKFYRERGYELRSHNLAERALSACPPRANCSSRPTR